LWRSTCGRGFNSPRLHQILNQIETRKPKGLAGFLLPRETQQKVGTIDILSGKLGNAALLAIF